MLPATITLDMQLDLREGLRIQTSHNVHKLFSIVQQGVTCLLAYEAMGYFVTAQGPDVKGLGRWSWLIFTGKTITTCVVIAYLACTTQKQAVHATIAQQRQYWKLQGNRQCPRKLLCQDLVRQLKE